MWLLIELQADNGYTESHVLPEDELDIHSLTNLCWCKPKLDEEFWIATHNSIDGREKFESGERKYS